MYLEKKMSPAGMYRYKLAAPRSYFFYQHLSGEY